MCYAGYTHIKCRWITQEQLANTVHYFLYCPKTWEFRLNLRKLCSISVHSRLLKNTLKVVFVFICVYYLHTSLVYIVIIKGVYFLSTLISSYENLGIRNTHCQISLQEKAYSFKGKIRPEHYIQRFFRYYNILADVVSDKRSGP